MQLDKYESKKCSYLARSGCSSPEQITGLDDEGAEDAEEGDGEVTESQAEDEDGKEAVAKFCPSKEDDR